MDKRTQHTTTHRARMHARRWATLVVLLVLASLLVRMPVLFQSVVDRDEGLYTLIANEVLKGRLPYTGTFDHKPPVLYYLFALAHAVFGTDLVAIRLLGSLCTACSAVALALTARRLGCLPLPGFLAACAFLLLTLANGGMATNAEVVMMAPAHLGLACLAGALPHVDAARRRAHIAWGGVLMSLSVGVKLVIAAELPGMVMVWLLACRAVDPAGWLRRSASDLGVLALGFLLCAACWSAPHWATGHGATLWRDVVAFNLAYVSTTVDVSGGALFLESLIPFIGSAVVCAWFWTRRPAGAHVPVDAAALGCLAWTGSCLVEVAMTGRYHDHYFLVLCGPVSLLLGLLAQRAGACAGTRAPGDALRFAAALATVFLLGPLGEYRWPLIRFARDIRAGDLRQHDFAGQVAGAIAKHLQSHQTVYLYNYHPALYHILGVEPPTRFAFPDLLTNNGYPLDFLGVDRAAEVERVLAGRPDWLVVHHFPGMELGPTHPVLLRHLHAGYQSASRHPVPFYPDQEVVVYSVRP